MNSISNMDDVIDSRDVIARIEELEGSRKPYVAGCNMPGYMPDNTPSAFADFDEAREAILSDLNEALEMAAYDDNGNLLAGDESDEAESIKAAIADLNDATEGSWGATVGSWHYWITPVDGAEAFESPEDFEEYRALKALADEASGYAPDWEYGETLIRDSYFRDYAQELAEDIGAIDPKAGWPLHCIDWEQAARELQMDYTAVSFAGVTYWVR